MTSKNKSPRRSPSKKLLVSKTETKEYKASERWINGLYDTSLYSDQDLITLYDHIKYKGFNRIMILSALESKFSDFRLLSEIVILCALRGPKKAAITILSNGKTLEEMGIPATGTQGTEDLSCNRISAATADLAAFYLRRLNVPKRIQEIDLPGWLQFPTAGSIKMPPAIRNQHYIFHKTFSPMIGGVFNEQIYQTMAANSYLDPKLRLFE